MSKLPRTFIFDLCWLSLSIGLLYFIMLGTRPLFVPDEGRYAEIAREMYASGDYITPYLNGIKYFEKPVLFYWLSAFAVKIGGLNLWSLRLVNAILSLIGVAATYITSYQLYNRKTALLAALLLATSTLYFVMGHMVNLDLTVTVFLSLSLYAFLLAWQQKQEHYFLFAAVASALAVLTKGLIGIVFPLLIIGLWIIICKEWIVLKRIHYMSCVGIFLLIVAPWHILVGMKNPEFYYFYFIEQQILRYATEGIGHFQPFWFFIPAIIFGLFPWVVFLPQAIIQARHHKVDMFFLIWAVSIFLFFSFSHSKLIPYILPIFPPLAILIARYLHHPIVAGIKLSIATYCMLAIFIAFFLINFVTHYPMPAKNVAALYLYSSAVILAIASAFVGFFTFKNKINHVIYSIVLFTGFFLICTLAALPAIDTRSILPLAEKLKPILQSTDVVISYNQYFQDLPFYLQRKIRILNWRNELTFGMSHQSNAKEYLINDEDFWQLWNSDKRVFAIMANDEFAKLQNNHREQYYYLLERTINNVLLSNARAPNKLRP